MPFHLFIALLHRELPRNDASRAVLLVLLAAFLSTPAVAAAKVDFIHDVQPLLADNCYHCHGPDERARKARLRLDTKEGAFRLKDGKALIVPGKSDQSEFYKRLVTTDPDELMPPPDSHRKLTSAQIETLKRWIDQGASWGTHWAFVTPSKPAPPRVRERGWARNEIDRFVLARLEAKGLKPSAEAAREVLIRRVSLDLTGLPPTLEEVDFFLKDRSPRAYENLVTRLLDSEAYGERMASEWLDAARFADTHGFQMDRYRPVWPYRDWVIRAFNRNLPLDQFVTWQLAGDLLPDATLEQRLATVFNRLHLQNEEGGIVEEEFRTAAVVDRVNTMGTAFMGMTFECARCHDHKYDPISQKDFYQLFSFFNNIDEFGQTSYFTDSTPVPALLLADKEAGSKIAGLRSQIRTLESRQKSLKVQARPFLKSWLDSPEGQASFSRLPGLVAAFEFDSIQGGRLTNQVDASKPGEVRDEVSEIDGRFGRAVLFNGDNGIVFKNIGIFSRTDPFSYSLWIKPGEMHPRMVVLHRSQAANDAGSRGYEILLENGHVSVGLHHMWPGNSLKIRSRKPVSVGRWSHLAFTYDGSSRAEGLRLYLDGVPAEVEVIRDGLSREITYERSDPDLQIGSRFRDNGFKGGSVDSLMIFNRALTLAEIVQLAGGSALSELSGAARKGEDSSAVEMALEFYVSTAFPPAKSISNRLWDLRKEESRLVQSIPEIMAMAEMPEPRPTRILKRGAYDDPGELVVAGTPAALPPMSASAPRNRLGLAQWLVSESNPLTSRVLANRAWQMMFGRGLVETSDNFGTQGTPPTHPELLDWLAVTLRTRGWDLKALLKEIAMSAAYRQSSHPSDPKSLSEDPENLWLSRGPSRRLTAEMLRDQALAVSGLLVGKIGGPSVKPYQPEGIWEEKAMGAPRYEQGRGEDLYRRSLYTFWKRTVPHPAMMVFDAADRNTCIVRRQSTSTPLQSLALLNDIQMIEAARFLGERMLKEGGSTPSSRLAWMFRLVTSRSPNSRELEVLERMFREQRELFFADPQSTTRLLSVGESASDPSVDPFDLAAATMVGQAMLNHDAAVMRR